MKKNHKHLNIEELLYFLLGIIDPTGNILQKKLIDEDLYTNIINKIKECKKCQNLAKIYFEYNLKNTEEIPEVNKKIISKNNNVLYVLKVTVFILLLLLEVEYSKSVNFNYNYNINWPKRNLELSDNNLNIDIYKKNKTIGAIQLESDSKVKITHKKLCRNKSIVLENGKIKITLKENVPLCLQLDKNVIILNQKNKNKEMDIYVSNIFDEEGNSYKEIKVMNGELEIWVLPEYKKYDVIEEETLSI